MKYWIISGIALLFAWTAIAPAEELTLTPSDSLNALANKVADSAIEKYSTEKLKADDFSITIIDLHDPAKLTTGNFNGEAGFYPASVVKLFYLGAVHRALEDGKLKDSPELRRGMHDMIVDSVNDATNWLLEAVTDAGNGPLLSDEEMSQWEYRRNSINRYYASLGYKGINTCQKTFIEGPYGRDKLFLAGGKNRNNLTTIATARLLATIVLGKMVTPDRSKQMMELLHRDMSSQSGGSDDQAHGFSAMALPTDAKLWSKAGWTNTARHDAAYIEMPDGRKFVSVIFTYGHARQKQILPSMVTDILAGLEPKP